MYKSDIEKHCDKIEKAMNEIFATAKIIKSNRNRTKCYLPKGGIITEVCFKYGLNVNFITKLGAWNPDK